MLSLPIVWSFPMRFMSAALSLGLAGLLLATPVVAAELEISDARLRVLPGERPGAGYFQLHNPGEAAVAVVGAETDAYKSVELHMSMEQDGMAMMHGVERFEVGPGETREFAPQGYHLMFMQPQATLNVGDDVDVTLLLEGGGEVAATFEVVSPAAL
ncbi:copper chaperone PCu(A)C [Halomonas sp. DP4Y7-2]|uniref:copper chaperone PCu(A)C n=2 Tax=unclassified Halomonas TaxID=2609666 RepID=UPI0021BD4A3D|nr:copper chaperone PCu(A)C [Halomonas sp. DP4Y7-2]